MFLTDLFFTKPRRLREREYRQSLLKANLVSSVFSSPSQRNTFWSIIRTKNWKTQQRPKSLSDRNHEEVCQECKTRFLTTEFPWIKQIGDSWDLSQENQQIRVSRWLRRSRNNRTFSLTTGLSQPQNRSIHSLPRARRTTTETCN